MRELRIFILIGMLLCIGVILFYIGNHIGGIFHPIGLLTMLLIDLSINFWAIKGIFRTFKGTSLE